jgi:RNAse (barnase) inhibitor barstar
MQSTIKLPVEEITDWPTFHMVFQRTFGFPDFYGRNMDAWVDCMTSLDTHDDGLTTITLSPGEMLILRVDHAFEFRQRCPEQYNALIECCAFVNYRRVERGESPVLGLLLVGLPSQIE